MRNAAAKMMIPIRASITVVHMRLILRRLLLCSLFILSVSIDTNPLTKHYAHDINIKSV